MADPGIHQEVNEACRLDITWINKKTLIQPHLTPLSLTAP
jgi:hypothetical protein